MTKSLLKKTPSISSDVSTKNFLRSFFSGPRRRETTSLCSPETVLNLQQRPKVNDSSMKILDGLIVLSIFRLGQIVVMGSLFLEGYRFSVDSSFDLICGTSTGTVNYTVQFPFLWISVTGLSHGSSTRTETTTCVISNFGMPSGIFMFVIAASLVYCVGAVLLTSHTGRCIITT